MITDGKLEVKRGIVGGMEAIEIINAYTLYDKRIEEMVKEIVGQGNKELVFNCKKLSYITSTGIGQMMRTIKEFQKMQGTIYLYGASEDLKDYLKEISLDKYFKFI